MSYIKLWFYITVVLTVRIYVPDSPQTLIALVLLYIIWRVRQSVSHKQALVAMRLRRDAHRLKMRESRRRYQRVYIPGYVSMIDLAKSTFPMHIPERTNKISLSEILSAK